MKRKTLGVTIAIVLAVAVTGAWWMWQTGSMNSMNDGGQDGKRVLYWHDPMVPGPKFDKPGKSPFMDMQLVPKYAGDEGDDSGVKISANVAQNLGVRIGKAETGMLGNDLQALGRVAFDERDIRSVQTRTGGFIERLYVRAVGDIVTVGQKVADVYAPDLLSAQHELLALSRLQAVPDLDAVKSAARERLRLLGMNDAEIEAIEASGTPRRSVGVYAPVAGVVQELGMREGAQVMPGQTLLQVAGLNRVWVLVELPERDLGRVQTGQTATIRLAALPDTTLNGKIEYIYPRVDEAARTGQVRILLANPKGQLRPGMYAQVDLAAKKRETLTVPSEAVITTGTRALVIVRENNSFRPAEVKTGTEANGRTEIRNGLTAGEEVVLSGQFLIDSEASLKGVLARLGNAAPMNDAAQGVGPNAVAAGTGVVTQVDPTKGTVTLSHGPMPDMKWPAMTMGFKLRDPKAVEALKPGAKVTFDLKRQPEGNDYVIESIKESGK